MFGVKKNLFKILLLGCAAFGLMACGDRNSQISGIVAQATFETVACQPQEKTIKIRNNDTEQPQRVQGVLFELGTNNDKFYKVIEVSVNSTVKKAVGDLVEEVQLAPGAVMMVKVAYNPKKVTVGDETHATYLDIVLNGPKLGVMQIELLGKAPTALEGCGAGGGNGPEFEVLGVKTTLSHTGLGSNVVSDLNVAENVEGSFRLNLDGEKAVLPADGFPVITFPLPAGSPIPELEIKLADDSPEGSFAAGVLQLDGLSFSGSNVVNLADLTLTTGTITIGSDKAPNVLGGTITFTGSPMNEAGEMTVVVAAPLTVPPVDTVENVGGGVFGMEIRLKQK